MVEAAPYCFLLSGSIFFAIWKHPPGQAILTRNGAHTLVWLLSGMQTSLNPGSEPAIPPAICARSGLFRALRGILHLARPSSRPWMLNHQAGIGPGDRAPAVLVLLFFAQKI